MMKSSHVAWCTAICAVIVSFAAEAQELRRIPVDHNDPALQNFSKARSRVLGPQPQLPPRDIPVLNFVSPPLEDAALPRAFRKGAARKACRQTPIFDSDPGWYAIRHACGDVVITITGEQRVQSRSAAPPPQALAKPMVILPASGDPTVEAGFVAEITLYRFGNIPYAITVECNKASVALCTSESQLRSMIEKIDLIAVPEKK